MISQWSHWPNDWPTDSHRLWSVVQRHQRHLLSFAAQKWSRRRLVASYNDPGSSRLWGKADWGPGIPLWGVLGDAKSSVSVRIKLCSAQLAQNYMNKMNHEMNKVEQEASWNMVFRPKAIIDEKFFFWWSRIRHWDHDNMPSLETVDHLRGSGVAGFSAILTLLLEIKTLF